MSKGKLAADYPAELGAKMRDSYVDMREAGERFYRRALAAGVTDPEDPNLEVKVFGRKLGGGIGNAMGRAALMRRLRLAREGWPKCYWHPDYGERAEGEARSDDDDRPTP